MRAAQHARREQALRGARRTARAGRASSSSAWKSCAATGRRSRSRCSASCIGACSRTSRSTRTSRRSCGRCASGALDDALVYRKNLRKVADDYTATTPPHVAAARKSTQPQGRLVSYVMTTAGAEPLDNVQHPLDREHYVAKQVSPSRSPCSRRSASTSSARSAIGGRPISSRRTEACVPLTSLHA